MSTLRVVPDQSADLVDVVAAAVRAHMAYRRVTQVQLAEILGIKQVSVSERLRGKTPFRLEEIQTIAETFGMHPAELLGGNSPSPTGGGTPRYRQSRRDSVTVSDSLSVVKGLLSVDCSGELDHGGIAA